MTFQLGADEVRLAFNDGSAWPGDVGTAVVDWSGSFPETTGENATPAGLAVQTPSATLYIDHDGDQRLGAMAVNAHLQISEFVHVVGDVAIEMGPTVDVNVSTGLPSQLELLDPDAFNNVTDAVTDAGLTFNEDLSELPGVEMSTMTMGATDVNVFVGMNGPYKLDENGNRDLSDDEANDNASGLWFENVDVGLAQFEPTAQTLKDQLPSFRALTTDAQLIELVGFESLTLHADDGTVGVNLGSDWPGEIGTAVIDWATSFAAEVDTDLDDDGKIDPAGFEIDVAGTPVYIDFEGDQLYTASVSNAELLIAEYLHLAGNFAFTKGASTEIDIRANFPSGLGGFTRPCR